MLTSAQTGITCGVPDERAVRAIDSGGHGSRGLGWREVVGSRKNPEVWTKGQASRECWASLLKGRKQTQVTASLAPVVAASARNQAIR